jgi:putative tryptophan/tyrosine transport system substrate-binding protein
MKRRDFITLLGGAAAWPLAARAQQAKVPIIGFLGADETGWSPWTAAFVARLRELGWIEGHTVAIEYRWEEGRFERYPDFVAEFVRRKFDLIVTNSDGALAAKQATTTIPIVFVLANDPLGNGLVQGLARPGANVTGLSLQSTDLAGKRLELLREAISPLRRLAIMADANSPEAIIETDEVEKLARPVGIEVRRLEIRRAADIFPAFQSIRSGADALYVVQTPLIGVNRTQILAFALTERLPTMLQSRDFVQGGALMSYGPSFPDLFRRAAEYVDKILRGTKPGDIPVEQPTKFELVLNLSTAKALGLTVPDKLLALANEVIE